MLDTNVVSEVIKNPGGDVAQRVRAAVGDICISIVVAAELRYGGAKKKSLPLQRRIEALLAEITVLPIGEPADVHYGALRAELEEAGQPIGVNDLLIAAHARAIGAPLVTANLRGFRRVPGLTVESWQP